MKGKKHIDNLFQEGFKNFEATPSPDVWANIQAKMTEEKDDRKVIPLWWKLAGVAALVALLVTIGISLNNTTIENPSITNTEETPSNSTENNNQIVTEDGLNVKSKQTNSLTDVRKVENNSTTNPTNNSSITSSEDKKDSFQDKSNLNRTYSSTEKKSKFNSSKKKNGVDSKSAAEINKNQITSEENKLKDSQNNLNITKNNSDKVALEKIENEGNIEAKSKGIIISENFKTKDAVAKNDFEATKKAEDKKQSIFDAVVEKDKTKKIDIKDKPENRWNVQPNVAPVYYSSLGNGSSLDESFSDNKKSGDVNLSYGVQVSYSVSKKLSIRTGVSNVNLSYSTGGVEVGTGPVSVAPRSVNYTNGNTSAVLFAVDRGNLSSLDAPGNGEFGNITPKSTQGDAFINQKLNYVEVPLELKYALLDNKIGVNLIGGLSSLFLSNNEVSVSADNFDTVIGEANNLNPISFTTNIGLGLDYKISEKFLFNIEPMFKYQLNPYTDSQVSFKPYYLGVYTGFSFKF